MSYFVYLIECSDKSLYCGITTNLERRVIEHNTSNKGAKYTKARRPVRLVYSEAFKTRSEALRREHAIKSMSKMNKMNLFKGDSMLPR